MNYKEFLKAFIIFFVITSKINVYSSVIECVDIPTSIMNELDEYSIYSNNKGVIVLLPSWNGKHVFYRHDQTGVYSGNPMNKAVLYYLDYDKSIMRVSMSSLVEECGYNFQNLRAVKIYEITSEGTIIMGIGFNHEETKMEDGSSFHRSDSIILTWSPRKGSNCIYVGRDLHVSIEHVRNGLFLIQKEDKRHLIKISD